MTSVDRIMQLVDAHACAVNDMNTALNHGTDGEYESASLDVDIAKENIKTAAEALQAENAKLVTALAACRDAFPAPKPDATLDSYYTSAMADPLAVPDYVRACVGAGASPVGPSKYGSPEIQAMILANLMPPSQEQFCYCNDEISLQIVSGGGGAEGLYGSVQLKVDGGYVRYVKQPSQDADPNAPWLSDAHALCTDHGIAQGNITDRIRALRDKLEQTSQAVELPISSNEPTEAQLFAGVKGMRLFITKNSVKDSRDGFVAAINTTGDVCHSAKIVQATP